MGLELVVCFAAVLLSMVVAVDFSELDTTNITTPCATVVGMPYCGQYISYAVNSSTFSTKEAVTNVSDGVFQTYVAYLQSMQPMLQDANFDADGWQTRCLGHIAYYYCLEAFPACVDPSSGEATEDSAFEVRPHFVRASHVSIYSGL